MSPFRLSSANASAQDSCLKQLERSQSLVAVLKLRACFQGDRIAYQFLFEGTGAEASLSFAALDQRARCIAGHLQKQGRPGDRVLLFFPPGLEYIAAFMGILYAGMVAVPLYPPRANQKQYRAARIMLDCGACVALTESSTFRVLSEFLRRSPEFAHILLGVTDGLFEAPVSAVLPEPEPGAPAFLQYTSGSTGEPKGVVVTHGNLMANERVIREAFCTDPQDLVLSWLPLYHDMGLIGTTLHGLFVGFKSVLMASVPFIRDPISWLEGITRFRASLCGAPNFGYELCLRKISQERLKRLDLRCWKVAFNGAEPVRQMTLARFCRVFAEVGFREQAFFPCYGMAEATLFMAGGDRDRPYRGLTIDAEALKQDRIIKVESGKGKLLVSCGRAGENHRLLIVDPESLCPIGEGGVGEIWFAGPSVADGYWNQPQRSRDTFGARLQNGQGPFLRSGDLGFLRQGELYITGRLKDLIIIRGRNYYAQDIEWTVAAVDEALRSEFGVAFSAEIRGEERLIVVQEVERHAVRRIDVDSVSKAVYRAVAEQHELNLYALLLVKPGRIAKTSSGKLRRSACRESYLDGAFEPLGNQTEKNQAASNKDRVEQRSEISAVDTSVAESLEPVSRQVLLSGSGAERFQRVLEILKPLLASFCREQRVLIAADVSLHQLGFDSIKSVTLQHQLERIFSVEFKLAELLVGPSLEELANGLLEKAEQQPVGRRQSLKKIRQSGPFPLSQNQRALWFLHRLAPRSSAYNVAFAVAIRAPLDIPKLKACFAVLWRRHAALRTLFFERDDEPRQRVALDSPLPFRLREATAWTESRLQAFLAETIRRPFDLEQGPAFKVDLFTRPHNRSVLLLTMHHLIIDFWSVLVLMDELRLLYEAPDPAMALPVLTYDFADFVHWQADVLREPEAESCWAYWERQWRDPAPVLELPTDLPRPRLQTYAGATHGFSLDSAVSRSLLKLAQRERVSSFTLLLACYQLLLYRYSGQRDLVVGIPSSGRNLAELDAVVGYFVNTLPIRVQVTPLKTFTDLLALCRERLLGAIAHGRIPFQLLVERLQPERDSSFSPIFQTMFVLQQPHLLPGCGSFVLNRGGAELQLGSLCVESFRLEQAVSQFDLTLTMVETDGTLAGSFEYNSDLFKPATIATMTRRFEKVLTQIAGDPHVTIAGLDLLEPEERRRLLQEWGRSQQGAGPCLSLCDHVSATAARLPDGSALTAPHRSGSARILTYAELERRSDRWASRLLKRGFGEETLIGIRAERSAEMVIAVLAVLKAGAAFVPLDPELPDERLQFIIADAGLTLVLTTAATAAISASIAVDCEPIDAAAGDPAAGDPAAGDPAAGDPAAGDPAAGDLEPAFSADVAAHSRADSLHAAYVIYTSGSTGKPKGVLVPHRAISSHVWWNRQSYIPPDADRFGSKTSFGFDVAVIEMFLPLFCGGVIVVARPGGQGDADYLLDWIRRDYIQIIEFTPSMWAVLAEHELLPQCTSLKRVSTGGEAVSAELVQRLRNRCGAELFNFYGPTETAVGVTWFACASITDMGRVPIGKPLGDVTVFVADRLLNLQPVGIPGELLIGGAQLARAYLNRPGLTARQFIPSPFESDHGGERLYRSGDLVRFLPGGDLDFLGRLDRQVKIRGFRIELGEIERALLSHDSVNEAVVQVTTPKDGLPFLAAHVVGRPKKTLVPEDLRRFLSTMLPHYMVPAKLVVMPAMPRNSSGKVNLQALPKPVREQAATVAATTPTEGLLLQIWREILALEQIDRTSHFFDLGGHSLLATRLVSRVRRVFDLELPLRVVFELPILADLARRIDETGRGGGLPEVVPEPRTALMATSFAQQRLWFLQSLAGREHLAGTYNMPAAFRLYGELDPLALEQTICRLVARHEGLRSAFSEGENGLLQGFRAAGDFRFTYLELSGLDEAALEQTCSRLADGQLLRPFDLEKDWLFRVALLGRGSQDHLLLLSLHHIVADGWSVTILEREMTALYKTFVRGLPATLPPAKLQYVDYAYWQKCWLGRDTMALQAEYWRNRLEGAPPLLELPTDRPRPPLQTFRGLRHWVVFQPNLAERVETQANRAAVTPFMLLETAFAMLMSSYSGQRDISVGTPVANRNRAELEDVIGFFVNTLVIRHQIMGNPTFSSLLRQTRKTALAAYAHSDIPFEQVVEALEPERHMSHSPLFQVVFALQESAGPVLDWPLLVIESQDPVSPTAKFDLTLTIHRGDGDFLACFEYNRDLFDSSTLHCIGRHFLALLEASVSDPEMPISQLLVLHDDERQLLLNKWNWTRKNLNYRRCFHHVFEKLAGENPDETAVRVVDREKHDLSYVVLNHYANRVAAALREHGVGPETPVAVCTGRQATLAVGFLAVLKAGGSYLPLDPDYPHRRLRYMLEDSGATLVLTHAEIWSALPPMPAEPLFLDEHLFGGDPQSLPYGAFLPKVCPQNAAYMIYTSGSTGQPKGAVLIHAGLCNLVMEHNRIFGLKVGSRVLQFASMSFDASVWEMTKAFGSGGTLVIAPRERLFPGPPLARLLREERINQVILPPSALANLPHEPFPDLENLAVGGEACPPSLVADWMPGRRFFNAYGPTEATVCTTIFQALGDDRKPPIGRPLGNAQIYILNRFLQPVPSGAVGELLIGGAGLARGYLFRPDQTAAAFIPNPFDADTPGSRLYRSGDLVRFLPGGDVDYLGRLDHQIKIRGFRIELGEIESLLSRHESIREAVVMVREDEVLGKQLVAYLVPGPVAPDETSPDEVAAAEDETPLVKQLREYLRAALPPFMLPARWVVMEKMPLTGSGKIDRRRLPKPARGPAQAPSAAPRNPTETLMAGIWCQVLGLERVGVLDNFFELGGHSLMATRVISRVKSVFAVELAPRHLFTSPTIALLCSHLPAAEPVDESLPPLEPQPRERRFQMSFSQQRLWFLEQLEPGNATYNIPLVLELKGRLRGSDLEEAFLKILDRHEVLRTRFIKTDDGPLQEIRPGLSLPLRYIDLNALPRAVRPSLAEDLARAEGQLPFDLNQAPLMRVSLIRHGPDQHLLALTLHHIVSDGWSMGVLLREMSAFYGADREPSPMPATTLQFADYALWQRRGLQGKALARQLDFWRDQLADAEFVLELPTDHPRPPVQTHAGEGFFTLIERPLSQAVEHLARRQVTTPFMVLETAFALLLSRYSNQNDICLGTPVANRPHELLEPLIGFFVNTLVLRTNLTGKPDFLRLLEQKRSRALAAYAHQDLPFDQVVEAVQPERNLSHSPLFQVMFALQNLPLEMPVDSELSISPVKISYHQAKFDITWSMMVRDGEIHGYFEYNRDLFQPQTMRSMADRYVLLLENLLNRPELPVDRHQLMDVEERRLLLQDWNGNVIDWGPPHTIHELFAEQVARTPEEPALLLTFPAGTRRTLSYRELDLKTNLLARLLHQRGVGPECVVGLCVHRSEVMVVALLAILKAGGVYVPLDPELPAERLGFMAANAAMALCLVSAETVSSAACLGIELLSMDGPDGLGDQRALRIKPQRANLENAAYMIYTSGSTGKPKGVVNTHLAVCNRLKWMRRVFPMGPGDRFVQKTPFGFDVSLYEFFGPLLMGACLLPAKPDGHREATYLKRLIQEERITHIHFVPGMLRAFLEQRDLSGLDSLKRVFCSGEALTPDLQEHYFRRLDAELYNLYGPTEAAIEVTWHKCIDKKGLARVPIGKPIVNNRIYILDGGMNLQPAGLPGELHIGGVQAARGYAHRPELTAMVFIPDPYAAKAGARLYKSGDLARFRHDGVIEYFKRLDHQVKLRGFRIELGEIENVLSRHGGVRQAVVLIRQDEAGNDLLVAYLVLAKRPEGVQQELRRFLGSQLPAYMLPASFVFLEEMPVTSSGKLNRRALQNRGFEGEPQTFMPPETAMEQDLAAVWREILGRERIGIHDRFFEIGGNSLLATRVQSRLEDRLDINFSLRFLFEHPTIAQLAPRLERIAAAVSDLALPEAEDDREEFEL